MLRTPFSKPWQITFRTKQEGSQQTLQIVRRPPFLTSLAAFTANILLASCRLGSRACICLTFPRFLDITTSRLRHSTSAGGSLSLPRRSKTVASVPRYSRSEKHPQRSAGHLAVLITVLGSGLAIAALLHSFSDPSWVHAPLGSSILLFNDEGGLKAIDEESVGITPFGYRGVIQHYLCMYFHIH